MRKITLSVATLILSLSVINICWANPLDVDIGCAALLGTNVSQAEVLTANVKCPEVSATRAAPTVDIDHFTTALSETGADLYRIDTFLGVVAILAGMSEKSAPSQLSALFEKPEVGWLS